MLGLAPKPTCRGPGRRCQPMRMERSEAGKGGSAGRTFQSVGAENICREVVVPFRNQQHRRIPAEAYAGIPPMVLETFPGGGGR